MHNVHNREVNNGDVNKVNIGACKGEVVVDSGESIGEVVSDGIGGTTNTSVNCGEVKCGAEAREDCGDEFGGTNAQGA